MGHKVPVVYETQVLTSHDGSDEKESRKDSFAWLQSKEKQCSLDTAHKHGWKPLTVSAAVLFSFAFTSFILAVIIEVLAQQSQKNGGLALSASAEDIPTYAKFGYLFLPTIVAVIYSLLWSWIDLDVKRLQPWLEMSRPEGATATRSIFLDYPYDFVAFVPMRAAKRRHWAVFYSGTVMVMIFWLITPLQSAILGSGPVDVQREIVVSSDQVLRPASEQITTMDQSILNEGYAITWLGQPYPPYTTADYTLLPFGVQSDTVRAGSTNWTGTTTKYWTQLECWPADIYPGYPMYDFLDGRGCNASDITPYGAQPSPEQPYKMSYIGYHNSAWADYWLSSTCSKAAAHQFLAIWARYKEKEEVSSVFCETNYFKQQVNATVSADTKWPLENSIVPVGPREKLSPNDFNSSSFEHLLGAGVSSTELDVEREYPFGHLLEQHHQVKHYGLRWPSSPLVGFAIGSQNVSTLDPFQDNAFLGEAFNATHKMLFSLALRRMLTNSSGQTTTMGVVDFEQHGIIVSRLFSAVVEGLLFLVGLFSVLLWWHGKRAPSQLNMDPASLGSLMGICQNSPVLLDKFAGKGCLSDEKLKDAFDDMRFRLFCGCQSRHGQMIIKISDSREEFAESQRISLQPDMSLSMGHYSPVKPLALRRDVGILVILSMIGAAIALIYLKLEEQRIGGLIRPTTNFELLQILENYIPTVFATLLEPFWVLVNRLLCIIQPFKDLWSGQRSAKGSINARYTSVPPQFVFWRAARSGHFVLVAICLLALLSNLLAVGLGGLFNELPVVVNKTCEFQQTMKPLLSNDSVTGRESKRTFNGNVISYEMQFYIAMNNVSQGTPLPPWVDKDYFFQPFTATPRDATEGEAYTVQTRGFGVTPSCSAVGTVKSRGRSPVLNYTFTRNGETFPACPTTYQEPNLDLNITDPKMSAGPSTAETVTTLSQDTISTPCEIPLVLSWTRSSQVSDKENGEMETWFVVCTPVFTTSMFNVTVDPKGHVLESVQTSEASTTLDYPLSTNNTDVITTYLNRLLDGTSFPWHNDTLSRDWMNYLLKIQPGNADILDPSTTPNTTSLIPSVETVYRQLYALLLSLNPQFFENHTEPVTITGTERHTEIRIFMDTAALAISLSVLALNIAVAVALYGGSIKHFLPRMPTTIGSTLAYVAASRAVREYDGPGSLRSATFSFGRYVGDDGRAHVGIEMDPFVVPVKLSALKKGDTEPRTGLFRRVLGRRKAGKGDTWL